MADTSFNPFAWFESVMTTGPIIKRVAVASVVTFGTIGLLKQMGFDNMTLLAALVAMGVLLTRGGYMTKG